MPLQVRELPAAMASVALSLSLVMSSPITVVAAMQIAQGGGRAGLCDGGTVLRASSLVMATPYLRQLQ